MMGRTMRTMLLCWLLAVTTKKSIARGEETMARHIFLRVSEVKTEIFAVRTHNNTQNEELLGELEGECH